MRPTIIALLAVISIQAGPVLAAGRFRAILVVSAEDAQRLGREAGFWEPAAFAAGLRSFRPFARTHEELEQYLKRMGVASVGLRVTDSSTSMLSGELVDAAEFLRGKGYFILLGHKNGSAWEFIPMKFR